ncbi:MULTISPECIES: N-acetylmuramoyl-L-alanine amidase [unclassified Streptomyces]|uniref:peptidoglycan recognition protein family protein n=1 Tax=unclassified Streptomyces TaxID=2593676 RepID=UPI0023782B29|nr:N-acetylmuramoyl-L-alanine amidase [Streptomyces sp. TSRI0281]
MPGWRTNSRNHKGPWGPVHAAMIHHTAGEGPGLSRLCFTGTPQLPGPLCHDYLDRAGRLYLVGSGRANHAGTVAQNAFTAVLNGRAAHPAPDAAEPIDGNRHSYGLECENSGALGREWTPAQYDVAVRVQAARCRHHGWSANSVWAHREATRRKPVDPRLNMGALRAAVAARLAHPANWNPNDAKDDDMPRRSNPKVKPVKRRPGGQWLTVPLSGGLVTGPADYSGTVFLRLSGVPAGAPIQTRYVETTSGKRSKNGPAVEHVGTEGDTFIAVTNGGGHVDSAAVLSVEYIVFDDADTHTLVSGQAQVLYWK